MDARIEKTKKKLKSSVLQLLKKKNLEEITVKELCDTANINRSTFYVHYGNVVDVFEEITNEIQDMMKKRMAKIEHGDLYEYLGVYFDTARKNRVVFLTIHKSDINHPMIQEMTRMYAEYFHINVYVPKGTENLEYNYMLSGFFGMVRAWLENGCKEDNAELIQVLERLSKNVGLIESRK